MNDLPLSVVSLGLMLTVLTSSLPLCAANSSAHSPNDFHISLADPGAQWVNQAYQQRRASGRVVPDTLDLQDNGVLAIWALTAGLDPDLEYRAWFSIYFDRRPLCLRHHQLSEFDALGKYLESLTLMRLMTGSNLNLDKEAKLWELLDRHTKADGLVYYEPDAADAKPAYAYTQARALLARICRYELNPSPALKSPIENTLETMVQQKLTRGFGFGALLPACRYYELTENPTALKLAGMDYAAMLEEKLFAEAGSFGGHFHMHTGAALGLLAYGQAQHDTNLIRKVCKIYEFARAQGTEFGYFPEALPPAPWVMRISNEGCCTADMTCLAAGLSRSGVADYWDDLDRYLRNQLTELQMKRTDFTDRIPQENQVPIPIRPEAGEARLVDLKRFIGCFAGWAAPNDFAGPAHFWLQQCCLGNCPRGLYAGWDSIVTSSRAGLRVNLLLNRSTPEIDVDSFLPYEGKVNLRLNKAAKVAVRIPGWVNLENVQAKVNGRNSNYSRNGRYCEFEHLKSGDTITLSFPLAERVLKYKVPGPAWASKYSVVDENSGSGMELPKSIGQTPPETVKQILAPVEYSATYRGNTIVDMQPAGGIYPLYQRFELRGKAPLRSVNRYVPEKLLRDWY